jgi:hypothetical protein
VEAICEHTVLSKDVVICTTSSENRITQDSHAAIIQFWYSWKSSCDQNEQNTSISGCKHKHKTHVSMQTLHVVEEYGQPTEMDRATQDVGYIVCFG